MIVESPTGPLPRTPEEADALEYAARRFAYLTYRKHTRPYRRAFRGIISRREAERFVISRARVAARAIQSAQETS